MGLSVALSNALSGMRSGQSSLEVLSRNVANAGVPGYHRQSSSVIDALNINSSYVREGQVTRAFNDALQNYYTRSVSESGFTSVRASVADRLQMAIGKPGTAGSIDSVYADFRSSLAALAVSPEDYAVRGEVVAKAQSLATTLNGLSANIQGLRRETEAQMQSSVERLNGMLSTLERLNTRLADHGADPATRAALLDQRDRLVADVAQIVDVRADYRSNGTVSLMTRTGVGILDDRASVFSFESAGVINATSQFSVDSTESGVGRLIIRTPSGLVLDAVQQNAIQSGELGALIELRDRTLVQAQDQLDQIASGLALAMSTVRTEGTAVGGVPPDGYFVDAAGMSRGNDLLVQMKQGGVSRSIRLVNVEAGTLPMDVTDAAGNRVIGIDFSATPMSAVVDQIQAALGPGFAVSNPQDDDIQILGVGGTEVLGLAARKTVTGTQTGEPALSLFVDNGNADFTDSLDGVGQRRGFAARISVNSDVVENLALLVQMNPGDPLGGDERAGYLVDQLAGMHFASFEASGRAPLSRLVGNVGDLIAQTMNLQGSLAAQAISDAGTQEQVMQALAQRMDAEYGVNVDEEMGRLMELQNAYAANARVFGAIQELLQQLMQM